MREQAQKALEQIRKAAADLGQAGIDATLSAMYLEAVSYTAFYVLSSVVLLGTMFWSLNERPKTEDRRGRTTEVWMMWLFISTMLFIVFSAAFFLNSSWMGIVSPEAALATEIIDSFSK